MKKHYLLSLLSICIIVLTHLSVLHAQEVITLTTRLAPGAPFTMRILASSTPKITGLEGQFTSDQEITYHVTQSTIRIEGTISELSCPKQQLTALDITGAPSLSVLDCSENELNQLDLSASKNLSILVCSDNDLSNLDFNGASAIFKLWCSNNPLERLDLKPLTELGALWVYDCGLKSLDLSHNKYLSGLDCSKNFLEQLDLSSLKELGRLVCNDNNLEHLDLSANVQLDEVLCARNRLTQLNLSGLQYLQTLKCGNNKLEKLDLSSCLMLTSLYCEQNRLQELSCKGLSQIETLWCWGNDLSGEKMDNFITSLRTIQPDAYQQLMIVNTLYAAERNFATPQQINQLKSKKWRPLDYQNGTNNGEGVPYEGLNVGVVPMDSPHTYAYYLTPHQLKVVTPQPSTLVRIYSIRGSLLSERTSDDEGHLLMEVPAGEALIVSIAGVEAIKISASSTDLKTL